MKKVNAPAGGTASALGHSERLSRIVIAPVVSEKSTRVGEQSRQMVFKVLPDASKPEVRKAVEKMFDKGIYKKEFITFDSDFFKPEYENSSGNVTYFVFKDKNGERYGEAILSVFIKSNPIDVEVYQYFIERILFYARTN